MLVSFATSASLGSLTWPEGLGACALFAAGMTFSWATRKSPPGWVKVVVAAGALGAMAWFGIRVDSGPLTDIVAVEVALTGLFAAILVVHSFHVPAATDLVFALVASAGLMAVSATQAIDLRFGLAMLAWVGAGLWTLGERWRSASGGGRTSPRATLVAVSAVVLAAAAAFLVLPTPAVSARLDILDHSAAGGPVAVPVAGGLAGDAGQPAELSKPGSSTGPTRVGGYLGFAGDLDTAIRGRLGHRVVMRVRTQRPSYWVGETFDHWNGRSWSQTEPAHTLVGGGSPFALPVPAGNPPGGRPDLQTFSIVAPSADLVFHAGSAAEVWFPSATLFTGSDGTVVSPIGIGRGAVYTVESRLVEPSPAALLHDAGGARLAPAALRRYTQLPRPYRRAAALARSVTAGQGSTYAEVEALIGWLGEHTRYSTAIPPLPPGADTVDEFLFGNRVGYCEQISTSLAVMLRSMGIPAREAVGYVPGSYDPVTGLYTVRANDAHAWVQVWFPRYGWQSFDPTASVPLANPSPGAATLTELGRALGAVPRPALPGAVGAALVAGVGVVALQRWRRRPRTWAGKVARHLERAGRSVGRPRQPAETLTEYASELDHLGGELPAPGPRARLASAAEQCAYGGAPPPPRLARELAAQARRRPGRRRATIGSAGVRRSPVPTSGALPTREPGRQVDRPRAGEL